MKIIYIFFFLIYALYANTNQPHILTWTSINVNAWLQQGDAHLISKNNQHILIDTGHIKYAKMILIPFLQKKHITHLKSVLITHPHNDHYGGLKTLLEHNISIENIYMNMPTREQMQREYWGGSYDELLEIHRLAKEKNIPILPIHTGDTLSFDKESYMKVLYVYNGIKTPVGPTGINDMSVVSMLYHGKHKFLFTGDLNRKLGEYIAQDDVDIQADILKAPHHGAEGFAPNSFFEKVNPKVLIVPAPKLLWFQKRSKRTRDLAIQHNYITYVNGYNHNITVISDGTNFTIQTDKNVSNHAILGVQENPKDES